jgi:glycosyltransferase involved in cell wall biosynthesis
MRRAAASAELDLIYFPATYSYFPVAKLPRIVTVFDTMALDHPGQIFPNWRGRLAWTVKEHLAVRSANHVVTVSEASRRSIEARFRMRHERISVVPCAPSAVFYPRPDTPASRSVLSRYGIPSGERYLLYVGGLSPHKNLIRLIDAFARLHDHSARLVLVGDLGDVFHTHVPELRAAVTALGLDHRVIFTGFVPDADLAHVYSRALALVQPSLIEGFGLPPVEAMACGTPVVSSTAGSLPEVVSEAGRYFDPHSVWSMTTELARVLENPDAREELAARARTRAAEFSWTATAQGVLAACENVAKCPSRGLRTTPRPHLSTTGQAELATPEPSAFHA